MSCGFTHTAVVSLDLVKCKMQVDPNKYKGLVNSFKIVMREEGALRGLTKGWVPTYIGYAFQGFFKYGLYEVFKDVYMNMAGEDNTLRYRGLIYLAASATAEWFADIALCPFEMVKVKVQTSKDGTWPIGFTEATKLMWQKRAETKFPFGSLGPVWGRQIPKTMSMFFFFEKAVSMIYAHVLTKPKESYDKVTQLGVTFAAGYAAGILCAIVSHPSDVLVSLRGMEENKAKSFVQIAKEAGVKKLLTKGLGTRMLIIGALAGFQWYIYDAWKAALGMGTTGNK